MKQISMLDQHPADMAATLLHENHWLFKTLRDTRMIRGWIGLHQACVIALLARQYNKPSARLLNIGVACGYSVALMAHAAPRAKVVGVDPYGKAKNRGWKDVATDLVFDKYDNANLVQAKSWDYLADTGRSPCERSLWDMIFVDGKHDQFQRDIPWFNCVRVGAADGTGGGLFLSHDYIPGQFDVVVEYMDKLREKLDRPFDVGLVCHRNRGMVGFYRRSGEHW